MSQIRFDKVVSRKSKITKEGYVKGDAPLTRVGVFEYVNTDGSIRRELRHPDEVFNKDSLETLKLIPVTNDHPSQLVNADNAAELTIGMVGENLTIDSPFIVGSYNITHKDGVNAISRGKKAFSLGYTLDLVREDGEYQGERYDYRQTNIKYNHLALVSQGRAGREVRINFDNALFEADKQNNPIIKEIKKMNEDEAKILQLRNDQLEKEVSFSSQLRASEKENFDKEKAQLEARLDQLTIELTELKSSRSDSLINDKARQRVNLLTKASKVLNLDSELDALSDREIMEKVIVAHDGAVNVSEKSDEYITARFDALIEFLGDKTAIKSQMKNLDVQNNTVFSAKQESPLNIMFQNRAKSNL